MVPTNGELLFRENENAFISCTSDGKPNSLTFSKTLIIFYNYE